MLKSFATTFFAGLLVTSFVAPETAHAQRRKVREVKKDTRELRDDRQDKRQFARFAQEVVKLQGKPKLMRSFDAKVIAALQAEKSESKRELRQDNREVKRSKKAVRRSKAPLKKLDAKIDRADDKIDRAKEAGDLGEISALRAQYAALKGKASKSAVAQKVRILNQAAGMQAGEIRKDKEERREDIRDVKQKVRRKGLRR